MDNPVLASGNYETYLRGAGIHDAGETYDPITGEWVPDAGAVFLAGNHRADLWFLNGDFDRDRDVDAADLAILNANTGTGTDWSEGDADGDGDVDGDDLGIVQGVYGAALPAAPAFPGQVNAYALSPDSATVEWATPNYAVSGYRIYRSDDGFSYFQVGEVADPLATSWTDQDLLDGEHIWYRVRAYTPDGSTQAMQADDALTLLPAPSNLNVSRWDNDLTVWWDVESTSHDELLLEKSVNGGNWQTVATLGPWDFDHDVLDVPDGGAYDFRLTAIQRNPDGTVLQTSAPGVMAAPFDYPFEAPGSVNATVTGPTTALITWSDWSVAETGYLVERAIPGFTWSVLETTPANATSYTDSTMAANSEYHYRVTTVGAGTHSTTQTEAVAHSSQASEARPESGQAGYLKYFSSTPPAGGWPGWSSSDWTGGALGEFDMDEDVTFRLGELQKHSHLNIFAPTVSFHLGDDLEVGKRFTIALWAGDEELYRLHMDCVLAADGLSIVAQSSYEWLGTSAESGLFEHKDERVTFSFEPSIGTVPGGGGGGGGGPIDPPSPGGFGPNGFGGGGMSMDPTTWVISHFGASPLIDEVEVEVEQHGNEALNQNLQTRPVRYRFTRQAVDADRLLDVQTEFRNTDVLFAREGIDFFSPGNVVHFGAGVTEVTVELQVVGDQHLEPHETVMLKVLPGDDEYRILTSNPFWDDQANRIGVNYPAWLNDDDVLVVLVAGRSQANGFSADPDSGILNVGHFMRNNLLHENEEFETLDIAATEIQNASSDQGWGELLFPIERPLLRAINGGLRPLRGERPLPLALAGYSWGGGAIHDVMARIAEIHGPNVGNLINLLTTAYVDGIKHLSWYGEDRRPPLSVHHISIFQGAGDSGVGNLPHGNWGGAGLGFFWDIDDTMSHSFWVGLQGKPEYAGLLGLARPAAGHDNRFVHSDPYDDDHGEKQRIDHQQPIMHYIGKQILEAFQ